MLIVVALLMGMIVLSLHFLKLKITFIFFMFRFSGGRCYVVEGKMLKPATIDKVVMK